MNEGGWEREGERGQGNGVVDIGVISTISDYRYRYYNNIDIDKPARGRSRCPSTQHVAQALSTLPKPPTLMVDVVKLSLSIL